MFEIGRAYEICELVLCEDGYDRSRNTDTVIEIDGPLVKFKSGRILNTASPLFHSASDQSAHYKRMADKNGS